MKILAKLPNTAPIRITRHPGHLNQASSMAKDLKAPLKEVDSKHAI